MFAAAAAGAQTPVQVTLTAPYAPGGSAVTAFGYYMSPYSGTVDGSLQRLNCVDFFHDVMIGDTWTAIQTSLGAAVANAAMGDYSLLGYTRDGTNGGYTLAGALAAYEKVAWLTTQYPQNPGSNQPLSTAIQTAIWTIASNSSTYNYASNPGFAWTDAANPMNNTSYWVAQANSQYNQQAAGFYDSFYILTDRGGSLQEFVTSTPEPGTLVLLATGLLLVAGFVVMGRRNVNAVGALS